MKKIFLISMIVFASVLNIISASDVLVWQGQYYTGTTFNTGTYEFNFTVYDALTDGEICYSNATNLTTGSFGEWKTEQNGVCGVCNNVSKNYFLEIKINGEIQGERRRITMFDYLRKNVDEVTSGKIQINSQVVTPVVQADSQIITPIVNATQVLANNITIIDDMNLFGTLRGHSPLKLSDEINFIKADGTITSSLYNAPRGLSSTLPSAFADSLIHDIIEETNNYGMQECFWDENTETMQMCISGAYLSGRATTISRSLQIVGNTTNKPIDENFTLCEGNNYVDCETDVTGADLLVEDDIEAIGSIFSQENITAEYFIGNGSLLTGISGENSSWNESYADTKYHIKNNSLQLGTRDAFGRNQIWNFLPSSILRLGALASDGDAITSSSEGIVVYGKNIQGDEMSSPDFGYARVKPGRFGLYNSKDGIGGYYFRVDSTSFYLADNSLVKTFEVVRETGNIDSQGNITADYFIGNGSLLTGISSIDTQKNALGYLYNDSSTIYLNETRLNDTIDLRSAGQWDVSGDYLYPRDLTKRVGINKANPIYRLDINGEIGLDGYDVLDVIDDYIVLGDLDGGGSNGIKFSTDTGNEVLIESDGSINANSFITDGKIQGEYYSDDGSAGITDVTNYGVCTDPGDGGKCNSWCMLQIKNGLITGCV